MSKIDDLERLQKLKECGAITEQEFEIEKKKILNEDTEIIENQQEPTNNKFCKRCGNPILEGEKFCGKCGYSVNENNSANIESGIWNIDKWIKGLKMSAIASIILTIIIIITNFANINIVGNICRIFCYISYGITIICFLGCTIISIVRKKKLPLWINIIQGIVVAVVIITVITKISDNNYKKKVQENIKKYQSQTNSTSQTQQKDSKVTKAIKEFADKIRDERNGSAKYSTYYKYKTTSAGEQVYKIKYMTSLETAYFYQLVSLDSNNQKVIKSSRLFSFSDYGIGEDLELEYAYEDIWEK